MKYFTPGMSKEEIHRVWKKWARVLHPDVGGDENEFKILSNEYAELEAGFVARQVQTVEELQKRNDIIADGIVNTLNEIYPRTKVTVWVAFCSFEVEIYESIPFKKVLHIVELVTSMAGDVRSEFTFKRPTLKRAIHLETRSDFVYINCTPEDAIDRSGLTSIYAGRRYLVSQNKKYAFCEDKTEAKQYIMKRSPKLNILELFNLESKNSLPKRPA